MDGSLGRDQTRATTPFSQNSKPQIKACKPGSLSIMSQDHQHDQSKPNALVHETSPYLLQHAYNPVNWQPWGTVAFEAAKTRDLPILLSVGYSACHWCHVMERESFENPSIAALMNQHFVCIKVDREERPDVDSVYMNAVQVMTGQGGWPMTVFMTHDGKPFYGGTYFPPEDRYGRPGFPRVLQSLSDTWNNRRSDILENADDLTGHLQKLERIKPAQNVDLEVLEKAFVTMQGNFDEKYGGFGAAPKFPNPGTLEFLAQYHARTGDAQALEMLKTTLNGMANGGMYDHLGGGFARYSTDERWLVPHFEKMLYDNAQLIVSFIHASLLVKKSDGVYTPEEHLYSSIAEESLNYVMREMTDSSGGFYSAQDADSEGVEGKYFVWSQSEIQELLGEDSKIFELAYGITEHGNWEHSNVLSRVLPDELIAAQFGIPQSDVFNRLETCRVKLFVAREERVKPGLDDKILTSWNGLMLKAFALAARFFGGESAKFLTTAEKNVVFVKTQLYKDGRLLHTHKNGISKITGMLEDYALYALGLLELYRTTFKREHLEFALELTNKAIELFSDPNGGFFDTPIDGEKLLIRPKGYFDSAMPSGNGAMAMLLIQLARLTGKHEWESLALEPIKHMSEVMHRQPTGFGSLLQALEAHASPMREIAIVGDFEREDTKALVKVLNSRFMPHLAVVVAPAGESYLPVLEQREMLGGLSTAYVCENLACQLPVTTPSELEKLLHF